MQCIALSVREPSVLCTVRLVTPEWKEGHRKFKFECSRRQL